MWSRLLAVALLLLPASALADVKDKVAALAPSGSVLVLDAEGHELLAQNADKPFVPASVAKIVTAWLAMEVLGADYRFETRFYLDANRVLAHDVLNSVSFNTVYAVRSGAKLRSEDQTPITPLAIAVFRAKGPDGIGRIGLGQDPTVGLQYAGELIAAFIKRAGGGPDIHLKEGSGISRDTRFTARGLAKVLALFAPHTDLLHGHYGGLNKTGTMDGVRTLKEIRE